MELFRKYLFLGPRESYHWPRFYVQTDPKWEPGADYWYTNRPVGKNTLGVYRRHDEEGGIEGNFKNHSMRKSTCTRLFRKGVDPQLIKEQTGHKSEAVMLYKKSNLQQKKRCQTCLVYYQGKWKKLGPHNLECRKGRKNWKKRKPSVTVTSSEGVIKKATTERDVEKKIKEDTKSNTKEGDVKDENKDQIKPSVVLDKTRG